MYEILCIFLLLVILSIFLPKETINERFEQVKIKLKPNPINLNITNTNSNTNDWGSCNSYPDVIVPIYSPWRTYLPFNNVYSNYYYPYYPFYYNNYY